jgi:hypothetical protein
MNTESVAPISALEGNENFVAFLHKSTRDAKIPGNCDKKWLAMTWMEGATIFMRQFVELTGKGLTIENSREFFRQAAELYEG